MLYIWHVWFWINIKDKKGGEVGQVIGAKGDVAPVLTSIMFSSYILEMSKLNFRSTFLFYSFFRMKNIKDEKTVFNKYVECKSVALYSMLAYCFNLTYD